MWPTPMRLHLCALQGTLYHGTRTQVYDDFGLADVIRKLFADPDWAAARSKGRDTSAAGFHGSAEAARLNRVTGGVFAKDSSSAYELGMDFGQIFNFKTHSTGIVLLRRATGCSPECVGSRVDTLGIQDIHNSADKAARQC